MLVGDGEADFYIETLLNMMDNLTTMAYTIWYGWPLTATSPSLCTIAISCQFVYPDTSRTRNWACFPRAAKAQLPARDSGRARPAGVLPRCACAAAERKTSGSLAPQTQLDGHWASGSIVPLAQVGCSAAGPVGASPHCPRVIGIRRGNRGGEKTYRKSGN